ncbi:TlpA disulfide reductase family protein [Photobacterium sp. 2_MG-2023]|uniref:TlpA family protein disulfide reductase n=1 Tax=unclassified Photobacterium TaxID=2628852 RepID=UPI001C46E11E|nr:MULTISPECIES: TlpA disulfide reductase family protein [unclassified Photobacterium]MBV7261263.1 TlpA family protein disulfide reductase [Photobacterium sp. WH24]MDO6582968.1 TlpA disulfide reductase family protein [Photobacterium sp. 2_MG-2023]
MKASVLINKGWQVMVLAVAVSMSAVQAAETDQTAPLFEAKTLSGQAFDLSDYLGKQPVYLKFWATWCSFCKAEMPHLNAIEQQFGDEIKVMSINVGFNDSVANIQQFFSQEGYDIPTIFDANGEITQKYQVVGTPHHILIDKDGKVAYRTFLATDQLDQIIEQWAQD